MSSEGILFTSSIKKPLLNPISMASHPSCKITVSSAELVNRKRAVCPHCGASLKIEWSRKRTNQQFIRIGKADICEEFQVIRCFELYAYYREGREPHYFIREVLQHWIKDDGKREVMALARNTGCRKTFSTFHTYDTGLGSISYMVQTIIISPLSHHTFYIG